MIDAGALTRCRHRVHLDAAFPEELAAAPEDPGVRQRQDAAAAKREEIRRTLTEHAPERWVQIDPGQSMRKRSEDTLAACAAGADRIWGAVLPIERDTGRKGRCEILVRDTERGGYIPVIVVNHKVTDPGRGAVTSGLFEWEPREDTTRKPRSQVRDQMRVAQVYRMLERHGWASPALVGGAIGYGGDVIIVHDLSTVLDEYDERFADRIAVARGQAPTVPSRIGECRSCPWWPGCESELKHKHDVSLVATGSRADMLREAGCHTIEDLAAWDGEPLEDWPHGAFQDAIVIAKAWLADAPLVRRHAKIRVHRADIEVDVDMESYQEHGAYLWGTLLNTVGVSVYRPFVSWDPVPTEDEARSFGEFWTWLMAEREAAAARGKTFAAYCYSRAAEDKWLLDSARRFAGVPGVPTREEVREFIDGPQWVDIYQAVTDQFICPHGKGLKKIAPVAGFTWRDADAGGEASMSWYREAVGYDGDPDHTQRERLLQYNEDDVIATKVLREWMSERAEQEIPLASEL
ncbi:MAG: TM0106 family RecB-like putative nuclease [Rhodococcus sp. (in: high G+C Gram-positive bacteria)]|uniref:TM0106 family RecB-like putative nuclease n=1 Tax=Rhodococcus sp. TaxID=1831 RepID=UPI003BB06CA7